jgi:HEAT repeats
METCEAKALIRMHAGTADGPKMATGFLGCLRPYTGLVADNFEEVVEATAAVADALQAGPWVDRELVFALWSMCSTARAWGVQEGGMLPRNHLISPADRRTLSTWVDIIECMTLRLLGGNGLPLAISPYAEAVAFGRLPAPGSRLAPLFAESLTFDDADVRAYAAGALGRMGAAAREAIPALRDCALDANPEVSQAVALAIEDITRAVGDQGEVR